MAAQPIVRDSYKNPVYTYETNVMGTVNICEAVRQTPSVRSFVNVTTDKVYLNKEWQWGYRENEELNGFDPYSNSKSCSELVTSSYKNSFFTDAEYQKAYGCDAPAVSTCRAGNVIGGGDFANDRIIPDCIRAVSAGNEIVVRNPYSTRPYQHVLEPVMAYLMLAEAQYKDRSLAGSYNVGPDDIDCWTTGELVQLFCNKWNTTTSETLLSRASWVNKHDGGPHEANFLKLDCSKLKSTFGWKPVWNVEITMEKIVEWSVAYLKGENVSKVMDGQIGEFLNSDKASGGKVNDFDFKESARKFLQENYDEIEKRLEVDGYFMYDDFESLTRSTARELTSAIDEAFGYEGDDVTIGREISVADLGWCGIIFIANRFTPEEVEKIVHKYYMGDKI